MINLLGIDPGSRLTGYGIIASDGLRHKYIASGCIRLTANDFSLRLRQIYLSLIEIIEKYQPQEVAVEKVFVKANVSSALKLGHARGAAITAATLQDLPIFEYTPRKIKQAVVSFGGADKVQIQHMVKCLLNLSVEPQADAADALAVAICHAHSRGRGLV